LDRNTPALLADYGNAVRPATGVQDDPLRWLASYPVHAGVATSAEIEDMIKVPL
jgi:hypothetical protein